LKTYQEIDTFKDMRDYFDYQIKQKGVMNRSQVINQQKKSY